MDGVDSVNKNLIKQQTNVASYFIFSTKALRHYNFLFLSLLQVKQNIGTGQSKFKQTFKSFSDFISPHPGIVLWYWYKYFPSKLGMRMTIFL